MAEEQTKAPPYISFLTFQNFLDWLREMDTIPSRFDRSFWGHKFSGSSGAQLMTGLRFLGLLEDDQPQERLEQLARASNEARKGMLADLLRDKYGAALVDGLPRMTPNMLNEQMRALGTSDGTHRKALSFFVNAAKAAELPMPANIAKQARNKPVVSSGRRSTKRTPATKGNNEPDPGQTNEDTNLGANRQTSLLTDLPEALVPLLRDLAKIGGSWDQEVHDRWLNAWTTMLDYSFPTKNGASESEE